MKKIYCIIALLFSLNSFAGFMDSRYFEPTMGCLIGGGVGYVSSSSDKAMVNGAIFCAAGAAVMGLINYHYDEKYGSEFAERHAFLNNQMRRYETLEKNNISQQEDPYFKKKKELMKPRILPNGQGIGPRVKTRLILKDRSQDLGE